MTGVDILVVAGLGALGALIRWGLWLLSSEAGRPWAIVLANTLGGLLAGLAMAGAFGSWGPVFAAGLFGAITTLSTLAVDAVEQGQRGVGAAARLLSGHVLGGVGGVSLGVVLGSVVGSVLVG